MVVAAEVAVAVDIAKIDRRAVRAARKRLTSALKKSKVL